MAGPGALLLLGGLLGGLPQIRGAPGGPETPPELEEEVSIVQRSDPQPPHCFTRTLHELSCFWDSPGPADHRRYRMEYRLEHDPWQQCPLRVTALAPPRGRSRFWCSLPAAATVTFVPLELRVLRAGPEGPPETPEGHPETPGTPEGPPETPEGPPETPEGPPETPEGPPETPETPEGHPGTSETTKDTERPPETPAGPPKTSETTGTPERPPKTTGTSETTERPPETPEGPPKTSETTEGPPETPGTTEKTPKTTGTSETTERPPETPEGAPKTSERPPGTSETPGTPEGPPETTETPPLFQRTIFIDQVVLPGPPQNVSAAAGAARGELCVRWAPPPGPYLHSSLVFELALSPPAGPPKTVGVPAGRREQRVGGLRAGTPYSVRARARPDGLSYGGFWSPWSRPARATTGPELDAVTLGLSCLLVLLALGLGALGLLGHRRTLRAKLWPPVPGPEREFEGLFSNYGGNFQLWLCQGPGSPRAPPAAPSPPPELEDAVEEVGGGGAPAGGGAAGAPPPPPAPPLPLSETPPQGPAPSPGPSPSPSFEYTLFDPGSALLCPSPRQPGHAPYANLAPPTKGAEPKWAGHAPHYVICS